MVVLGSHFRNEKAATLFHIFHLDAPLPGATAFANARSGVACCHRRLKNKKTIVRGSL